MLFHLVVHKDQDSAYGVTVPALEGCFSAGDTLEEAVSNTKEAILFHLEGLLEDGIEPPIHNPTLDDLKAHPDCQDSLLVSVDIDVSQYTLKPERFNVSWSKNLLRRIDRYVTKTHDNRSNFLAKASIYYIEENTLPNPKLQEDDFSIIITTNNTDTVIHDVLVILKKWYGIDIDMDRINILRGKSFYITKYRGTFSITAHIKDRPPIHTLLDAYKFISMH